MLRRALLGTLHHIVASQRILTSINFPGNSHGCGHITTPDLAELSLDMSTNSWCGGGTIQCPRCFILHHAIRLSITSCQSPPRTARCQQSGQCPVSNPMDIDYRLNEYVFINLSSEPVFVGSDSVDFSLAFISILGLFVELDRHRT